MLKVTALAGGVGAARFLTGLVKVIPPEDLTVIVNTGDDITSSWFAYFPRRRHSNLHLSWHR